MAIKYLHGRLMDRLISNINGIYETDVKYVIPVPANWHSSAEQFIRIAAKNAGIDQDRLEIVFEDQAAVKWCTSDAGPVSRLGGCKYMIIYLGGTSAEIIVHKQMVSGNIEEEHCSSCWQWNETYIYQKFSLYLENLAGKEALDELRKNEISEYLEIHNRFLNFIRNFKGGGDNNFRTLRKSFLGLNI
ncbi:uncharacterized protein LOC127848960 [Dreissena polymorpha]|uniref:uncharacterized protein LOC127848960 n=1 Tax=Dreissena polymorpha TaxID=45954 RepID=UPI0022641489|nr:uncharacterized protein LOC127848960 [Dreissena polymorpha]